MELPFYVFLLIAAAVIILPFLLGNYLARQFRMPDHAWKIGVILFSLAAGIVITAMGWPPKLGVDLSGGVILVYEVDPEAKQADDDFSMDRLIDALVRRVNPGGEKEVTVRPAGSDQVELIIPRADEAELRQMKDIISTVGSLEFRILANRNDDQALFRQADQHPEAAVLTDAEGNRVAWWVPVEKGREPDFEGNQSIKTRRRELRGESRLEVLVEDDRFDVTGGMLSNSRVGVDAGGAKVEFTFDSGGALKFGRLTQANAPDPSGFKRQLGIILNGYLYSAPNINEPITQGRGEISGGFSREEAEALVAVLNAGSLPTALTEQPISEMLIGPTLGIDTIRRGAWAIGTSMVVVLVFMLIYYRFAGLIACGALLMTLVLIMAIMITVKADLTLPGIAGLVLTVGMAVDANVLIFERIREELNRGAALRMAIRNGFQRATTTIVDANVTTLITAVILFAIGTDAIKGFALTLLLGVVLSMYTAIFCSRVVFDIAEKRRWIAKLTMMRLLGKTNIDFLRMRYAAAMVSGVIILLGLGGVVSRSPGLLNAMGLQAAGPGLLDIDFTGGVSVETVFREKMEAGEIRQALDELPDLVVNNVFLEDQPEGTRFIINTSQGDKVDPETGELITPATQYVEGLIHEAFGEKLSTNEMTFSDVETITAADVPAIPPADEQPVDVPPAERSPTSPAADQPEPAQPTSPEEPAQPTSPEEPVQPEEPKQPAEESSPAEQTEPAEAPMPAESAEQEPGADDAEATPADGPSDDAPADNASDEEPQLPPQPGSSSLRWLTGVLLAQADNEGGDGEGADGDDAETDGQEDLQPLDADQVARKRFAGGTSAVLEFKRPIDYDSLMTLISEQIAAAGRDANAVPVRLSNPEYDPGDSHPFGRWEAWIKLPKAEAETVLEGVNRELNQRPYFPSSNTIGGRVAGQMQQQAILALLFSLVGIVAYIWLRFQRVVYGLAAVVALVHDVLVTLGVIALSAYFTMIPTIDPFKIGLTALAAFLTIIGYSLNDTIVVFDRIREVRGKAPRLTSRMINDSINQTLSRTLLTSLTTLIVVVILFFGGGQGIHAFSFALVVGVIVGTYSSVFVASPFLYWLAGSEE